MTSQYKDRVSLYGSHYEDKIVSRPSDLYNGNPLPGKTVLILNWIRFICAVMQPVQWCDHTLLQWCQALICCGRYKTTILMMTLINGFSSIELFELRSQFHQGLFLSVQFAISQHWFRWWFGAEQATGHHLNQWWRYLPTHICVTRPWWVNEHF